jgi:hypothetical protein
LNKTMLLNRCLFLASGEIKTRQPVDSPPL